MKKVYVMELKKDSEFYSAIGTMELSRVPIAGDKLLITDKTGDTLATYVYNVVDVHLADGGRVDVCVINIGEQNSYKRGLVSSLVSTLALK